MARGWESKSIEAQIDMAEQQRRSSAILQTKPDPVKLEMLRKKETLQLSRIRVVRELDTALNPRYKAQLNKALADLDAQLSTIPAD
jgi:hypothetical protein